MASRAFGDGKPRGKLIALYAALIAGNLLAWGWALAVFHDQPVLLGTALLAYTLGVRHAFDADHIAAIDNVTRKLMQENKQPVAAGFFFSLGHSSVVIGLSLANRAVRSLVVQSCSPDLTTLFSQTIDITPLSAKFAMTWRHAWGDRGVSGRISWAA